MQQQPPRQRAVAAPQPSGSSPEARAVHEERLLEAMLTSLVRGVLPADAWEKAHASARDEQRSSELAFAFETVAQGKRLKAAPPAFGAEFLFQTGRFIADVIGDEAKAVTYFERALALFPGHTSSFARADELLRRSHQLLRLAELHASSAQHRPRFEQPALLRRATELLQEAGGAEERLVEWLQQILRLEPGNEYARAALDPILLKANRFRDVVRMNEQALASEPPPDAETKRALLERVLELYADRLQEPERALPHVEQLLGLDPTHDRARRVAHKLVRIKGLAGRAASALADAYEALGSHQEAAHFLSVELENTRGPKRAPLLDRLGRLKQRMGDLAGAFEAFEQALAMDPEDDVGARYVALALELGRYGDAVKTLGRVLASLKDPVSRSRTSALLGEVLLRAGDVKRATPILEGVLATSDAPADAVLAAAYLLHEVLDNGQDPRRLCDVLERIATTELDAERRRAANVRISELAVELSDLPRAIRAYERLLDTSSRAVALEALEPLYEATGDPLKRARLFEERAKDAPDAEARRDLMRAAEIWVKDASDPAAGTATCEAIIARFGAERDVLALLVPLLEAQRLWGDLASALASQVSLEDGPVRAQLLARLGAIKLQRLHDVPGAIGAFEAALSFDVHERTARMTLEKLAASGNHRIDAARVLEPLYRIEGARAPLLRTLDLRGSLAPRVDDRLGALREAADLGRGAGSADALQAVDFVARGLALAVSHERPVGEWLQRLEQVTDPRTDATRRAAILAAAIGDRPVDNAEMSVLAKTAAESLDASGDVPSAIALLRRALAFEPHSNELLVRIDELLREQGSAGERIALYRATLERASGARRRDLLHRIGGIQRHDLADVDGAVTTYRTAIDEDAGDIDAQVALEELYSGSGRWTDLCELLEWRLPQTSGDVSRGLQSRLARLSAEHGDPERARMHCMRLLDDPDLTGEHLDSVQWAADRLDAPDITRSLLRRRAEAAGDPHDAVMWLERLGELEVERRGDPQAGAAAWKRAAQIAESNGDDDKALTLFARTRKVAPDDGEVTARLAALCERAGHWGELPPLYMALGHQCADDAERIELWLRTAGVLADRLGDVGTAARHAGRAFELAPTRSDVLGAFESLSFAAGALDAFERALDEALARSETADDIPKDVRVRLTLARARVHASDPARADLAAQVYRYLLLDDSLSAESRADAVSGFEALVVAADENSLARRADHEWLLEWRASQAPEHEQAARMLDWASAVETKFADPARALALHKRLLAIDPESDEALSAIARLGLATGATDLALSAMRARRDRSKGPQRLVIEREITDVLFSRTTRWQEALESLAAVLAEAPGDPDALALATRALADPSARAGALGLLERAAEATDDSAVRQQILAGLLEIPAGAADDVRRTGWFERLCDLQFDAGQSTDALVTAMRAVREIPHVSGLWDRAEQLARDVPGADKDVAAVYEEVLNRPISPALAVAIGERAVHFYEEWFEDSAPVARVLERVLKLDPGANWAFDRLKLLLDAAERWDDLFALYDQALVSATGKRRASILEDAAQTAKDFADRPDRATDYLEQLRELRPHDARLSGALERLYERQGKHRELVTLLSAQLPSLDGEAARRSRARVATLWLEELDDPEEALNFLEPLLDKSGATLPRGATSASWRLLERILQAASLSADSESISTTSRGESRATELRTVRQRAAAWLEDHYTATSNDAELARVLLVRLEAVHEPGERALYHVRIAELCKNVGDISGALEQTGRAVVLAPGDEGLRAKMTELAERTGKLEQLATVLAAAADAAGYGRLRVELALQAASVRADRLGDAAGAISLLSSILAEPGAREQDVMEAARRLEPLLETAGRLGEQLDLLERIVAIEPDAIARQEALGRAARLAVHLGHATRAVDLWQTRLAADERDREALDGLVDLLNLDGRGDRLARVLELRAACVTDASLRRNDLARAAMLYGDALDRPNRAIDIWRAIEAEFGEAQDAREALSTLLRRTARWQELADHLERNAQRAIEPERKADHWSHLGEVLREQLGARSRAVSAYASALTSDATNERALAGLLALTEDPDQGAGAIGVLLEALRRSDDWRAILALTDKRVAMAASPGDKVIVLLEAAGLAEHRERSADRAFEAMREAFSIAPKDRHVQEEVARLAEAAGSWPGLVQTYRTAIARTRDDKSFEAEFWTKIGVTLEVRLGDLEGALDAYRQVVSLSKDGPSACAAVRAAGALGRWETAASVVVELAPSSSQGAVDAIEALERAAADAHAWDAAAFALADVATSANLAGGAARDVHARIAAWHRDRRHDPASAEASLRRALREDPENIALLDALAHLQRHHPDEPLLDTLVSLSRAEGGSLPLLREATEIARDVLDDGAMALRLANDVLDLSRQRWRDAGPASVEHAVFTEWALDAIAGLYDDAGDAKAMVDVLALGDTLPFEPDVRRSMRQRAARLALDRLGDYERAISLYLSVLEESPRDAEALDRLAAIYRAHDRGHDLLRLRERQIATAPDSSERIALRLEAAALLGELGAPDRAIDTLRDNLRENPVEERTVEMLATALEGCGRFADLRDLLIAQAGGDRRPADFWYRAALVAAERLNDSASAELYHQNVVALDPRAESFDALADLADRRGDRAAAAAWLEKWATVVRPEQRAEATLRLGDALVRAGDVERAAERLERAIAETPREEALRARLASLYREHEQWSKLARVIAEGAVYAPDKPARLERLLEAAKLFAERCAEPERAVSLLDEATDLAPDDHGLKLKLADALARAGRRDEARAILQSRIDAFGGRRPKERAGVHYQLAQLELAAGNRARALVELDAAARVDPQNPEVLLRLARLARDDGQLERAEKSYRALLVVLRRPAEASEVTIARSEVLLELSAIASRRGEGGRSNEILESALEAAAQSDFEQARLESALRTWGDDETLVRVLEARLARVGGAPESRELLIELAGVLSDRLGRSEEGLSMWMRAIAIDPLSAAAQDAALALARSTGQVQRYVEGVSLLVDRAATTDVAAQLLRRLGAVVESDSGDDARAAALYERALALDPSSKPLLQTLERVYDRIGDVEKAARTLSSLIEIETREGGSRGTGNAIYRLAMLRLSSLHTLEEGAALLLTALDVDPQFEVAERALRAAVALNPMCLPVLDLYERVGREPGYGRTLADALRLRAQLPGASGDTLREAVEAAVLVGDSAVAEALLGRFVESEAFVEADPIHASWALAALAEYRERAGDLRAALALKLRAADAADPDNARRIRFEIARIAADGIGDLQLASDTYLALHRADPADRQAWEALADTYRRMNETRKLVDLLASITEFVDDVSERAQLRFERVRLTRQLGLDEVDAATALREILDEDPNQRDAALMLAEIFERAGSHDELAALLAHQIEAAKDRADAASIASLSLRLGALREPVDRLEARNIYYTALDWEPQDRALLDSLLRLLGAADSAGERADILERRLSLEQGPGAESMALELWTARVEAGDESAAERGLVIGFRAFPQSVLLRDRLEYLYRQRGDLRRLAELLVADGKAREAASERVSRLREAAAIWWTELQEPLRAADALGLARETAPDDLTLLLGQVDLLLSGEDRDRALSEIDRAIESIPADHLGRASLFAARAAVRAARGDERGALDDFEAAFSMDRETYAAAFAAQLDRARATAESQRDDETIRATQLRRAQVLPFAGDIEGSRAILSALLGVDAADRDVLRTAAALESALEQWEAAIVAWRRLVDLEQGDRAIDATLALAEACERAGRPGDAREALERALHEAPGHDAVRARLERIYEGAGAWRELARLAVEDAAATGVVADRVAHLLRAGWLLLTRAGDPVGAILPLEEALELRPDDLDGVAILADAYTASGRAREAVARLERAILPYRGRRTRELAALHLRLARAAHEYGDGSAEALSLTHALECDSQSGDICSEVAIQAIEVGQLDIATRALRAVTLLKGTAPISRALAYQYLGEIARRQGDPKRALTLLRRALSEDATLEGARALIEAIERGF
ncbi:MAG: tetratricopeptide repeat protein [Polyangiaceae bacterium]|jgi:tetratricopeptide (TPR) repeat protein